MPIEVSCSRCGVHYEVPDRKAGRKGRCPTCGGLIQVPTLGEAGAAHHRARHKIHIPIAAVWAVLAGIVVLTAAGFMFGLFGGATETTTTIRPSPHDPIKTANDTATAATTTTTLPAASDQLSKIELQYYLIKDIEKRVADYEDVLQQERRLRARDVLRKIRAYEPVSQPEYEMRRLVLDERASTREAVGDWRLSEPLQAEESEAMRRQGEELRDKSSELWGEMTRLGLKPLDSTDPLGRRMLDATGIKTQLTAMKTKLEEELRAGGRLRD